MAKLEGRRAGASGRRHEARLTRELGLEELCVRVPRSVGVQGQQPAGKGTGDDGVCPGGGSRQLWEVGTTPPIE